ncbi:MAG: molybdopterin-dependent oxidoreductase, partial [Pseudomonadales bacterium]|nr:molybdopterin-dependent oxidoreductase [Pseudomonadales bacterium]
MVQLTRRKFLVASGCVAGGVTVLYTLGIRAAASAPTIIFPDERSGAAWIQIRPSGACHMYFPRQDMGQNANTGLAQIVAEELNILVADIHGEHPTTSDVPPLAVTAASMSLTAFSRPVALAAATLRESLRARAAAMLGEPLANIPDDLGGFRTANGRKVGYCELVSGTGVVIEFDDNKSPPPLYTFDPNRQKKQIGHSVRPLDIQALVTGAPVYAADVQVEGVLYGRVVQPPVRNAHIRSLDTQGVMQTPGLVKLVHEGDFVGVVCKTPSAVDAAMAQIKVTWNLEQPISQLAIDSL